MYSVSISATNDRSDEEMEREIHFYALKSEKTGYLTEYYEQIQCNSNGCFCMDKMESTLILISDNGFLNLTEFFFTYNCKRQSRSRCSPFHLAISAAENYIRKTYMM